MLEQVKSLTKHIGEEIQHFLAHRHDKKIDVREMIWLMHVMGEHRQHTLLGLTFNQYKLTIDDVTIEMETKGPNDEEITEIDVYSIEEQLYSYRLYDESPLQDSISLPEATWDTIRIDVRRLQH
ncbi:hypothetical protein [Alkalihalobacillus sp. LMS39]|uniref:hypothetical protein n=1 Tax=Alkalihalobacillus sp. LMS39 TaxID=2924032 RepID=UPI001FB367C6|nr:hypothetical protein [Alkalihalobacillus sp. LMS39]UOE92079.1 hypothetical protein MM271_12450 [Alkalihalobacillus sp. LMS39]